MAAGGRTDIQGLVENNEIVVFFLGGRMEKALPLFCQRPGVENGRIVMYVQDMLRIKNLSVDICMKAMSVCTMID